MRVFAHAGFSGLCLPRSGTRLALLMMRVPLHAWLRFVDAMTTWLTNVPSRNVYAAGASDGMGTMARGWGIVIQTGEPDKHTSTMFFSLQTQKASGSWGCGWCACDILTTSLKSPVSTTSWSYCLVWLVNLWLETRELSSFSCTPATTEFKSWIENFGFN